MTIDWELVEGRAWKPPTFTDDQIKAAQAAVTALPAVDKNPDHIALVWDQADKFPNISDIDFGDAVQQVVTLGGLQAATDATHNWLNRQKVLNSIQNPGVSSNPNPFTNAGPIITTTKKGNQLIVDGHHRLAALMFLGATKYQVWNVPTAAALKK